MAHFAALVKTDWKVDPFLLAEYGHTVAKRVQALRQEVVKEFHDNRHVGISVFKEQLRSLSAEQSRLLIKNSISPLPLHKVLTLLDCIEQHQEAGLQNHAIYSLNTGIGKADSEKN